jgi:hypothetical protein
MTVRELLFALSSMPLEAPVVIQGTSVQVYPKAVKTLADLRATVEDPADLWPFDHEPVDVVVVLTE